MLIWCGNKFVPTAATAFYSSSLVSVTSEGNCTHFVASVQF